MRLLSILALIFLTGCFSTKGSDPIDPVSVPCQDSDSKIIFLNYKISKDSEGDIMASLINKIIAEGKLKSSQPEETVEAQGDLECILQDEKLVTLSSHHISNPLVKNVEFINASGEFSRKIVELDSTELSLRMVLPPCTHQVSLELIAEPNLLLLEFEL